MVVGTPAQDMANQFIQPRFTPEGLTDPKDPKAPIQLVQCRPRSRSAGEPPPPKKTLANTTLKDGPGARLL